MLLKHSGNYHCNLKQLSNYVASPKYELRSIAFLVVPLVLVAFTHLWNPIEFNTIHPDEGYYIGRSIHVSEGLGPKEDAARYDHPYFGWLFLAGIFNIINYPNSANPTPGDVNSIETIWLFPRVTMGILAVIDTFLIYKIAERRYNRNAAFIAAILFAVMPYTLIIRYVLIEPIQLPFLLTSILFALYTGIRAKQKGSKDLVMVKSRENSERTSNKARGEGQVHGEGEGYSNFSEHTIMSNQNVILLLSSGIFLGLTIFTKVPAITLIPLVGFIVFTNNKKSFKALGIWIIPVILIPLIWPTHTVLVGEFDQWQEGIIYQTTRPSKPLLGAIDFFYDEDRVLLILGLVSFVFAAVIRKDFIFLIWVIPFLGFFYVVNYVSSFHLIPLIPAFCIGPAVMIADLSEKVMKNKKLVRRVLPFAIISAIGIFGLVSTTSLIVKARNSSDFDVIANVTRYLPASNEELGFAAYLATGNDGLDDISSNTKGIKNEPVTIVARNQYKFWIFKYVFDKLGYDYKTPFHMISNATLENARDGSEKILIIADEDLKKVVSGEELPRTPKAEIKAERISNLYNSTKTVAKTHNVEIRINY
jgi:Dolichyl-phosphate-mannose-protein mannosyltransferase